MPIYEYHCEKCVKNFEAVQKISDAPLSECPQCKSEKVKKVISRTSFQLKGSGWYATDYKKPGGSTPSSSGSE
jgi:putative FmdB family regulatory protein